MKAEQASNMKDLFVDLINRVAHLMSSGDFITADQLIHNQLQHKAEDSSLLHAYGMLLLIHKKSSKALSVMHQSLIYKETPYLLIGISRVYLDLEDLQQANIFANRALQYNIISPEILNDLAVLLFRLERYHEGLNVINKGLSFTPENKTMLMIKSEILHRLKKFNEMLPLLEKMQLIEPDNLNITEALGQLYTAIPWRMNFEKALACYEKLNAAHPNDTEVIKRLTHIYNTDMVLLEKDNLTMAYNFLKKFLQLSTINTEFAHIPQSIAQRVLDYNIYNSLPPYKALLDYWSNNKSFRILTDQATLVKTIDDRLQLISAFNNINSNLKPEQLNKPSKRKLSSKIRFGIISPNLRENNVGFFIWPIIQYLDKSKFSLYTYAMVANPKSKLQTEIGNLADFNRLYNQHEPNITAQSIADDHVDILLEVSTINYHPGLLAAKPAPIQITWLDSCNALGLPPSTEYIDYNLVDPYIQPQHPAFKIEKSIIMPHSWVALSEIMPAFQYSLADIPEERNGYITFGSLNAIRKLNLETLEVWADIMNRVPNSRFLYARTEMRSQTTQDHFIKHMSRFGIDPSRIILDEISTVENAKMYNRIDIALDTFPQSGGTTTCEAIIMGVPLVTLVGICLFERISYSNLVNSGLTDLCAFSTAEYIDIAVALAKDKRRRLYLKKNLRHQLKDLPLGKDIDFVDAFSQSLIKLV
jgi:predicted O-linked N-acetylglucosamine transferase (SPINDLY family)